jgi:hypothetical protein
MSLVGIGLLTESDGLADDIESHDAGAAGCLAHLAAEALLVAAPDDNLERPGRRAAVGGIASMALGADGGAVAAPPA